MDEDTFDAWWRDGVCAEIGADLFFVGTGQSVQEAKRACERCPVRLKCLTDSLEGEIPYGVFGGFVPAIRKALWLQVRTGRDATEVARRAIYRNQHERGRANGVLGEPDRQHRHHP